ncbi:MULTISPECIES: LamB/YcsF family protein [Rossellomorea]|jgi:5-oxoprolinase (ATP-hydrolysing) subunit A|uniref:LamB/YcsF family protein n=1 Tax=Rossellomorea TaxID=2837508 RepID=UPI0011E914B1|nr:MULTISPECIES: 5-oxoprolinase subunit PxpA [Rossellomorea]MDT9024434.1 5-oxoprolinase subunit PxpA [Rossellomorea sp. YC4-1]TYS91717.1 5-oxoprolinase subunit PxpA [Rossellomorea aquimaris]
MKIDLNCDLGESFGTYTIGQDEEMMKYVSSVNVACGFHAGDPLVMKQTVTNALSHNLKIGAHPGLPDLQGFGRRMIQITPEEAYALVQYQIGALLAFIEAQGGKLSHVKPHGALYNMAAKDSELAVSIAKAVFDLDPGLTLFGLSQSELTKAGAEIGLHVAHEVFADRTYQSDGSLTPRSLPNAVLHDENQVEKQVLRMVEKQEVVSTDGEVLSIKADTICLHGDNMAALNLAKRLYEKLS